MKILFIAPHSGIWVHAFPEALVAEALAQHGHEITYVGCGGVMSTYCVPMSSFALQFSADEVQKARICSLCKKQDNMIRAGFGFGGPQLSERVAPEDLAHAEKMLAGVTEQNCVDFAVDGIEVGRLAMYEMLLDAQKSSFDFSPAEWQKYLASLRNVLVVLRVMQRLLHEIEPDRIVIYNSLYAVNRTVSKLAEQKGIPQYFLHAGGNLSRRLSTLLLGRGNTLTFYEKMREKWRQRRDQPVASDALAAVTDHFLEVTRARSHWAYSRAPVGARADVRGFFGIGPKQKIICALMSSYDERFAAETVGALRVDHDLLFPKQVDWLRALIQFVTGRADLALVIRVHPRELSRKHGGLSEHARMLQQVLSDLPVNVRVNWPGDNISLYDIANVTDVVASAWSSSGKEMALLGIPVVLYSQDLVVYPSDLNHVGTTEAQYFALIERSLREGWSAEWIRRTYRWCAMEYSDALLDISASYRGPEGQSRSLAARAMRRVARTMSPYYQQKSDLRRRARKSPEAGRIDRIVREGLDSVLDIEMAPSGVSLEEETAYLRREVRRLVQGMYGSLPDAQSGSVASRLWRFAQG